MMKDSALTISHSHDLMSPNVMDWSASQTDIDRLGPITDVEKGRQSMKELAEFLRTKEPPPNNLMLLPDDASRPGRKLSFRFFQRKNSKMTNRPPRPFKLPDSAVAAKTTSGHWHIAISIPREYDLLDGTPNSESLGTQQPQNVHYEVARSGNARILKAVNEERPMSFTDKATVPVTGAGVSPGQQESAQKSATQQNGSKSPDPAGIQLRKGYHNGQLSSSEVWRQDSQRSYQRDSDGTIYSAKTPDTTCCHSRGISSISTAPSLTNLLSQHVIGHGVEPPTRTSSILRDFKLSAVVNLNVGTPVKNDDHMRKVSHTPKQSLSESIVSNLSDGNLEIAGTAKKYGPTDISNAASRRPGPAPTKKLPDLPERSESGRSLRPVKLGQAEAAAKKQALPMIPRNVGLPKSSDFVILNEDTEDPSVRARKRQERVKAIRARDMATAKSNAVEAKRISLGESPNTAKFRSPTANTPTREGQAKQSNLSSSISRTDMPRCKETSSMSGIMLVVDLAPYSEFSHHTWITYQENIEGRKKAKSLTPAGSIHATSTPPRSPSPSLASSDDETIYSPRPYTSRNPGTSSRSKAILGSPRQTPPERSLKPNPIKATSNGKTTGALEARLAQLEKSNIAMLRTLNAVVQIGAGFKDLEKLLPAKVEKPMISTASSKSKAQQSRDEFKSGSDDVGTKNLQTTKQTNAPIQVSAEKKSTQSDNHFILEG